MMKSLSNLHLYQHRMVDWILQNPTCALWAQPGLGKTIATLTALDRLIKSFDVNMTLIIAPLRVSQYVWTQEHLQWSHVKHLTFCSLYWPDAPQSKAAYKVIRENVPKKHDDEIGEEVIATEKIRDDIIYKHYIDWLLPLLKQRKDFYIINQEQVALLARVLGNKWCFDHVVIDEASGFKNWTALRTKALRHALHRIHRLLELTGSPEGNGLEGIFAQIFLLDKGERLGKTITSYRKKYFTVGYDGFKLIPNHGAKEQIYKKIEDKCMTLLEEDYLDVPPLVPVPMELEFPPAIRQQYDKLKRDFLLCFDGNQVIRPKHAAALSNKMLQFCNGAVYLDGVMAGVGTDDEYFLKDDGRAGKQWKEVHHAKLDALGEIITEAQGEPVLIAYNYIHDLQRILKKYKHAKTLDSIVVEQQWNRKEIEILVVHPASAGHGLNLQYGGFINVWFGLTWNYELYDQFNRRLKRQGQVRSVMSHHLVMKNSIETQMVMPALEMKGANMMELLVYMKKEIKRDPV